MSQRERDLARLGRIGHASAHDRRIERERRTVQLRKEKRAHMLFRKRMPVTEGGGQGAAVSSAAAPGGSDAAVLASMEEEEEERERRVLDAGHAGARSPAGRTRMQASLPVHTLVPGDAPAVLEDIRRRFERRELVADALRDLRLISTKRT